MKRKYVQVNKIIGVRFDDKTTRAIRVLADKNRWSMASAVAYCVEQQLKVAPSRTIGRRS